jgi:hypothetical protein
VVPDVSGHHPVAKGHVIAEPFAEEVDKLVDFVAAAGLEVRDGVGEPFAGGVVLPFVPGGVRAGRGAHDPLFVREMFLDGDSQRPDQVENAGDLRARAQRLLEFLRHPEQIAMFGVYFRKENGVRLRPLEMVHGRIVPDLGVYRL